VGSGIALDDATAGFIQSEWSPRALSVEEQQAADVAAHEEDERLHALDERLHIGDDLNQMQNCCARVRGACKTDNDFQTCFRRFAHDDKMCAQRLAVEEPCPFCGAETGVNLSTMAGPMQWCERAVAAVNHAGVKPAAGRAASIQSDSEFALEAKALRASLTGEALVISPDCVCQMNDWPPDPDQSCAESFGGPSRSKYPAHCLPGWCMAPEHLRGGGRKIQWVSLTSDKFLLKMVIPRGDSADCDGNYAKDFEHLFVENQASLFVFAQLAPEDSVPFVRASTIFETSVAVHEGAGLVSFFNQGEVVKMCPGSTWPAFLTTRICGQFVKPPGNPPGTCHWDWKGAIANSCARLYNAGERTACLHSVASDLLGLERLVARHSLLFGDIQLIANEFGITFMDTLVAQVDGAEIGGESKCGPVGAGDLSAVCFRHSHVRNFLLQGVFRCLVALLSSEQSGSWQRELPVCELHSNGRCHTAPFMVKVPPSLEQEFQVSEIGRELIGRLQTLFGSSETVNTTNGFVCMGPIVTVAAPVSLVTPPKEWSKGQLLGSTAWQRMMTADHMWDGF
jgi:hypothetical protein